MKADMGRKTARKYVAAGQLPSELKQPRDWRTRPDPFEEHWPEIEARLRDTPEFELRSLLPYFHNGFAKDLWAVVNFYNDRFSIKLTQQEKSDLVAFLGSL